MHYSSQSEHMHRMSWWILYFTLMNWIEGTTHYYSLICIGHDFLSNACNKLVNVYIFRKEFHEIYDGDTDFYQKSVF